ncbi:hypothetical protein BJ742DRAFT_509074 [Cladochytrium replicatum]|nr:hypothetical protein BJ742DRAFT_509074 [Cladochytrium replicatum]
MAWSNSTPPSRHPTRFWGRQFRALLTKHFLTSLRSPVFPVIVLLLPAVISAALIIIFYAVGPPALDRAAGNSNAPSSSLIQPFKITLKCSEPRSIGEPSQCPMVYYAPNDAYHTAIMTRMATMTGLRMNDHIRGFDSHDAMAAAFIDTIETVQLTSSYFAGVAWTTLPAAASSLFPNVTAYNVWEAKPLERGGRGMFTYDNLVRNLQGSTWGGSGTLESIKTQHIGLQIAIESATTSVLTEKVTGKGAGTNLMEVNWNWLNPAEVPNNDEVYLVDRQQSSKEYLLSSFNGGLGAVMPMFPLPLFAYTLHSISSEKQAGLLGPIKRMGLYESAYWMAALVIPMIMNIFGALSSALILTIGGGKNGVQWPVLSSIDLPTMLLLQFSHGCAFIGTAMFWSSMVSRTILVGLLVTIYAAFHLVLPMFLFGSFNWLLSLGSTAVHVLTTFLVPAITFGKVWFEISNTVLPSALNSNNATNFTIATAFNNSRGPIANTSIYAKPEELVKIIQTWTTLPTSGFSMITFIVSLTVAMWFAWYVDQVLPGSQEGFRRPFYFPFTMAYWTGRTVRRSKGGSEKSDKEAEVQVRSEKLGSVEVLGLTKVFGLGKKKHTAVDGIQFTLEKGSCSALLGVNGAGKSTTINMLTGMSNPTSGCAYIFGLDVRSEISAIQSMMGVCAQFDFLYPYLTAAEHVHFYARFRGVDPVEEGFANLQDYTMHKLRKVNLEDVHNKPVGGFSGGMKRRMSFTLATVGPNLKFILLDEVTTGLDPLSRRKCWKVVEELKRDKIVLLTTHSMEEAEALGDHVCIMQNGKVRASGSQIFLKSRFGAGYLLDFLAKEGIVDQFNIPQKTVEYEPESQPKRGKWFNFSKKPEDDIELQNQDQNDEPADGTAELLREWVSQSLHNFQVVSTAGRTLTIGVPRTSVNDLAQFFHSLDNQSDNSVEWAVSTTTLEEVFLKISADKAGVAGAGDIEDPFAPAPPSPASTNERSICSVCYREASELFGSGSSTSPVSQMMCSHCVTSQRAGSMIRGDRSFAPQSNRAAMSFAEFCRRRVGFASARNQPYPSHSAVHGQLIPDRTSNARRSRQEFCIILQSITTEQ